MSIFEEFEKINQKYKNNQLLEFTPSNASLNLEKFEYNQPTSEDIETQAKKSLENYLNLNKTAIEDNHQTKLDNIFEQKEKISQNVDNAKSNISNAVEKAKENASNNALKRGLARSTIIVTQMAAFDEKKLKEFAALDNEYTKTLTKLESEKALLETQKQNALSSFDIAYAVKLNDKISAINAEVNKKLDEVKKLNNQIAEKEAQFATNQEKENQKRQKEILEWNQKQMQQLSNVNVSAIEKLKQEEKFNIALDYLNALPKAEALSFIEQNENLKSELGALYTRLHAALTSRTN